VFCLFFVAAYAATSCELDASKKCVNPESDAALMLLQVGTKGGRLLAKASLDDGEDDEEAAMHEKDDEEANFNEQDDDADSLTEQEEDADHEDNEGFSSSGQFKANEAGWRRRSVSTMGQQVARDQFCGSSCYSPRPWAGVYSAQKCNEECTKRSDCAYFWVSDRNKHCGVCTARQYSSCRKQYQKGYNIYKKYVLTFPFKGTCKEAVSSTKRLGKQTGCANRAKKLRHVAWSYERKTCRSWKRCTAAAPGDFTINKAR